MADVFDLGEWIWAQFPELKPEQVGGAYKLDPLIYDPPFYDGGGSKEGGAG